MNRSLIAHWEIGTLLVVALLGAWLAQPGVVAAWLAVTAAVALALAAARAARPGALIAAGLAVAAAITALLTARQVSRVEQHWPDVREDLIQQASARLAATLAGAVSTARDVARAGADLGDVTQVQAFEQLGRIAGAAGGGPERGVVVRDSAGHPWAWAGRQRLAPAVTTDELYARITPFYAVLEARRQVSGGRTAVAHVVLAADSVVPDAPETVAARFARSNSVHLEFLAPGSAPRANDVFDYCIPACGDPRGADTLFSVRTVPPAPGDASAAALAGGGRVAGWLVVLLLVTLAAAGGASARLAAAPTLILLGVLTPLPERLGLHQIFSANFYALPGLGPVTASAGALALTAAFVILVAATAAGRFAVRRRPAATLGGALVVLALPLVLAWLADGVHVPAEGVGFALWLTWALALTLAGAAFLVVAAALFEAGGVTTPAWLARGGWIAVAWSGALALWGLAMWQPAGWPAWYVWAWLPAYALAAQPTRLRRRLVLIALVAGAAAAMQGWDAVQRGRLQLAERDVARLGPGGGDPVVVSLLDRFGAELAQGAAPRSEAELYARWDRSPLAADHYPVTLVTWAPDGSVAGRFDLAELDLPAALLQRLAVSARASGVPFVEALPRVPGLHYVLAVPYPDGEVVTVGVGPRSRLIRPARAAELLRGAGTRVPPFEISLSVPRSGDVSETLRWRRDGWSVLGEERLDLPGGTRHVHVQADLGGLPRLLTRGVLMVLLDALVLVVLWAAGAALAGRLSWRAVVGPAGPPSYRVRLTSVLAVFFVVPTVGFAAWTAGRSRAEARDARDLAIRQTLHDAENAARGLLDRRPELADRGLDELAASFGADLELYQGGVLTLTSADALAQLGLIDYYLPPDAYEALALEDRLELAADAERAGRPVRVGYQTLAAFSDGPAVLAAARPVTDPARAPGQDDLAYGLLLATLVGLAAAWGFAALAARALARPVQVLREAAMRVGQGEPVANLSAGVPVEFVPLAEAVDRMAQAVRVLAWGELARQIAHEIKNPLTPIRLGVQHLQRAHRDQRPDFDAQLDKTVKQILAEIERLDAIARAFARFGAPAAEAGPLETVDVATVATETAQLYALGGTTAVVVSGKARPARARNDEVREVLINLIENARDAGATEVRIALVPGAIVATDNGRGIPSGDLPHIFEPRFSTTSSGTGLGLAICRRLVESWGGTISVESVVGRGTVVTLALVDGGT